MAKQLSEGRAFPIFGYGSGYNLAVNSWLAAPLIKLFGATVFVLRLPLLFINLIVGNGLAWTLRRKASLGRLDAFVCCLWFAIPSFAATSAMMNACIGGVEPFLFLMLLFWLQELPVIGGFFSGIGIAQRPYVLYGVVALLWVRSRDRLVSRARILGHSLKLVFAAVGSWGLIRFLSLYSHDHSPQRDPVSLKSFRHMLEDVRGFFPEVIAKTIGLQIEIFRPMVITRDAVGSSTHFNVLGLALLPLGGVLLILFLRKFWKEGRSLIFIEPARRELRFPYYLVFIGFFSFIAYVMVSPPVPDIRYTLLLLFWFVGSFALLFRRLPSGWVRSVAIVFAFGCAANNVWANIQGWRYLSQLERDHPIQNVIDYLNLHDIRAVRAGYFSAFNLGYLSGERISVSEDSLTRVPENAEVFLHTPDANRIDLFEWKCDEHAVQIGRLYLCPYHPK